MEKIVADGEVILNSILGHVLQVCCVPSSPWDAFEGAHVDRVGMLKVLAAIATVSRKTRQDFAFTLHHAALRLASYDVELIPGTLSARRKRKFVLCEFEKNMEFFSKSWKLEYPVPEHFCTSPLHELTAEELHRLRGVILAGWQEEANVVRGDGKSHSTGVWVTPAARTLGNILGAHNSIVIWADALTQSFDLCCTLTRFSFDDLQDPEDRFAFSVMHLRLLVF